MRPDLMLIAVIVLALVFIFTRKPERPAKPSLVREAEWRQTNDAGLQFFQAEYGDPGDECDQPCCNPKEAA